MRSKVLKRIPLERLMDLKIDYAFKQLFGSEKNKEITVVFLNAILQRTGRDSIKDIVFSNIEAGGEFESDKQSRLDLLVVTDANEWINVEIQFTDKYDMVKRSIYYWSGVYRSQMKQRMGYRELRPVVAINLLNFRIFDQTERFHTTYHLYEDEEDFKLTNLMEFHFIEMPKLIQAWKAEELNPWDDLLARWLLLLGIVDHRNGKVYDDIFKELEEISMKDETLRTAFNNWEILSCTQEEMLAYEVRLKRILDEQAAIREAEMREEEMAEMARAIEEKKRAVEEETWALEEKKRAVEGITRAVEEKVLALKGKTQTVVNRERALEEKAQAVENRERAVENKERAIADEARAVEDKEQAAVEKARAIEEKIQTAEGIAREAEEKSRQETARLMLKDGFELETVARLSRLSEEQVIKIKAELKG